MRPIWSVVETGETRSTHILPQHIENSSALRPCTSRANDPERLLAEAVYGCSLFPFGLTCRKRGRNQNELVR